MKVIQGKVPEWAQKPVGFGRGYGDGYGRCYLDGRGYGCNDGYNCPCGCGAGYSGKSKKEGVNVQSL